MAVRSEAQVCCLSIAGIADSNPVEGLNVRLLCVVQVAASATVWNPTGCAGVRVCECVCVCVFLIVCDLETLKMKRPKHGLGRCATEKRNCYLNCGL